MTGAGDVPSFRLDLDALLDAQRSMNAEIALPHKRAVEAEVSWLEHQLRELVLSGVDRHRIEVRRFPDEPCRVVIAVDGVPKLEHRISWTIGGTDA